MTEKNVLSKQHFNASVDYEQTVRALMAFTALVVHDGQDRRANSEFGLGRRMSCVPAGPDVTPDLVAQRSRTYGVVAEVKKSLGKDQSHWMRCVEQAAKYANPLAGWFTADGIIASHDSVVLIHQSRSRKLAKFINSQVEQKVLEEPRIALVEFNQSEETASYYFFRLERGAIIDGELSASLETGKQVPLAGVLRSFPNVRYYDAPPPIPLLLSHLWTDYFAILAVDAQYDEKTRSRRIEVSVSKVTEELQRAYGSGTLFKDSRSVAFPKPSWVHDAFERLVRFRLARRLSEHDNDRYEIHHRNFRRDVREHFCELEAKLKVTESESSEVQPNLLDSLPGSEPNATT